MPICENCFKRGLRSYTVSLLDSARCIKYIRSNCFRYNILSLTAVQLETLSSTYIRLEIELEDAFEKQMQESFRIVRLQAQKKMWRKKLSHAIVHSVFYIEELEKLKTEETVRFIQTNPFNFRK